MSTLYMIHPMIAWPEKTGPNSKGAILSQLRAHQAFDEIVKGKYWEDGKGCAVGCTLHNPKGGHSEYEVRFGIPQMLARLEDTIFEGMPNAASKEWPIRFIEATQEGADLSRVGWKFMHWLVGSGDIIPRQEGPWLDVLDMAAEKGRIDRDAACAADSAADAAYSAAYSAAHAAYSAYAAARASAARAAAAANAAYAARAASIAADAAADAADDSPSAYEKMADKLIELIEAAPIVEEVEA